MFQMIPVELFDPDVSTGEIAGQRGSIIFSVTLVLDVSTGYK